MIEEILEIDIPNSFVRTDMVIITVDFSTRRVTFASTPVGMTVSLIARGWKSPETGTTRPGPPRMSILEILLTEMAGPLPEILTGLIDLGAQHYHLRQRYTRQDLTPNGLPEMRHRHDLYHNYIPIV
jgi:hypothetical protein